MRGFGREKIKNNGLYLHATFTSHKTLYVIMKEETQTEIIQRIKDQTEALWNTIQEAKKSNLKVQVGFDDSRVKPEIQISNILFRQG